MLKIIGDKNYIKSNLRFITDDQLISIYFLFNNIKPMGMIFIIKLIEFLHIFKHVLVNQIQWTKSDRWTFEMAKKNMFSIKEIAVDRKCITI